MATLEVQFDLDNKGQLAEMSFAPFNRKDGPILERNSSELMLPFHGEWYVYWRGSTIRENYHNANSNTRGAFDFSVWATMENLIEQTVKKTRTSMLSARK